MPKTSEDKHIIFPTELLILSFNRDITGSKNLSSTLTCASSSSKDPTSSSGIRGHPNTQTHIQTQTHSKNFKNINERGGEEGGKAEHGGLYWLSQHSQG